MSRPRLSQAHEQSARERLIQLALDLYLRDGLEGVTLRKLAGLGELSHTYVYRYFSSKATLLVAMRTACSGHFLSHVVGADDPAQTPARRLYDMAHAIVAFAMDCEPEYRLLFTLDQPSPDQFPELLAVRQQLAEHVAEVAALMSSDDRGEHNPQVLAQMIWAGVHGVLSLHMAGQLVHGCSLDDLLQPMLLRLIGFSDQLQ